MHLQQHLHKPWLKPHVQALLQQPLIEPHLYVLQVLLQRHVLLPEFASLQPLLQRPLKLPQQPSLTWPQQDNQQLLPRSVLQHLQQHLLQPLGSLSS